MVNTCTASVFIFLYVSMVADEEQSLSTTVEGGAHHKFILHDVAI